MTSHRLFPLEVDDVRAANVAQRGGEMSELWHKRYGQLNLISLKSLFESEMVVGLLNISTFEACESCSLGNQGRAEFLVGQARRAIAPLELIHVDLVGPMQNHSLGGNQYFSY